MTQEMEKKTWKEKSNGIRLWLEQNETGAMAPVIAINLDAGDKAASDEDRYRFWEAVRAICKTLPNSPIKKGRGSTLEPAIQACVDSVSNRIQSAFATISDGPLVLEVMLPHGKTGGVYVDIDAFATDMATRAVRVLKTSLKEKRWDGTMNKHNLTGMTPPPSKVTEESENTEDSH